MTLIKNSKIKIKEISGLYDCKPGENIDLNGKDIDLLSTLRIAVYKYKNNDELQVSARFTNNADMWKKLNDKRINDLQDIYLKIHLLFNDKSESSTIRVYRIPDKSLFHVIRHSRAILKDPYVLKNVVTNPIKKERGEYVLKIEDWDGEIELDNVWIIYTESENEPKKVYISENKAKNTANELNKSETFQKFSYKKFEVIS